LPEFASDEAADPSVDQVTSAVFPLSSSIPSPVSGASSVDRTTQSAPRARAEIISGCLGLKLSSRGLIASASCEHSNGKLGTAGPLQGGTRSSNLLCSSGESSANLALGMRPNRALARKWDQRFESAFLQR
jgi:hypothetical protein